MTKKTCIALAIGFLCLVSAFPGGKNDGTSSEKPVKAPDWVRDPYTKYDEKANVAVVGMGNSRDTAEKDALGKLVSIFGQSIQVDQNTATTFQQAEKNGVIANWSENTTNYSAVNTSTEMDALVGAEIGEVWNDAADYFAIAYLNKAKASLIYTEMVKSNQMMIDNLTNMAPAEKNTLNGGVRYKFAATVADMTNSYVNLLSFIGSPVPFLKKGEEYRLEANDIAKSIPIGIRVQNDKSERIEGAFAKVFSDLGFRKGDNASPYVLEVNIVTSPVDIANQPNKFTRIELKANLIDTKSRATLLPYNFNSREGHVSQSEADNRAYTAAVRKINEEYVEIFEEYISQLLPKK
jgi:hypothetical protein